jgi:dTDP-glucose pyrophosphorylase
MNVINADIDGVKIIEPDVHGDARGWFCEQYNAARYKAAGITADFVQDNESFSSKGVVRALIERQGLQISCIEEIAWSRGWIDNAQLRKLADGYGKSSYGAYLKNLVKGL